MSFSTERSSENVPDAKRKRDKAASKRALLESAVEVFAQRGYDAATTKEVAQKAGVSEGLIHRYFESKAGLLLSILTLYSEEEQKEGNCPLPELTGNLEQAIRSFLLRESEHARENQDFMRVVVSRSIVDPKVSEHIGKVIHEGKLKELVEQLKTYQMAGKLPASQDLESLAVTLSALGFTFGFMFPVVFGFSKERMERISSVAAHLLASGLQDL
jgi:AcrR family transcriptional regulator